MKRRQFAVTMARLGASAAGLALVSSACALLPGQPSRHLPRIGYLGGTPDPGDESGTRAGFLSGLNDAGYVEGETALIEWRSAS
jgi:hypothetical protein